MKIFAAVLFFILSFLFFEPVKAQKIETAFKLGVGIGDEYKKGGPTLRLEGRIECLPNLWLGISALGYLNNGIKREALQSFEYNFDYGVNLGLEYRFQLDKFQPFLGGGMGWYQVQDYPADVEYILFMPIEVVRTWKMAPVFTLGTHLQQFRLAISYHGLPRVGTQISDTVFNLTLGATNHRFWEVSFGYVLGVNNPGRR